MKKYLQIRTIVLLVICLNELSSAQSNVWISGKLVSQNNVEVFLTNDGFNFYRTTVIANTTTNDSSYYCFKYNISSPQVLKIWNNSFYITPGDSVYAMYTGDRFTPENIVFTGRNAEHYNYLMKYYSIRRSLPFKYFRYDFKNGPIKYLDSLKINKDILMNHLNEFANKNSISADFRAYALSQINYDFYDQMLSPIANKKIPLEQIPTSYSLIFDKIKLNNDNLIKRREYAFTAMDFIKYKKLKYNGSMLQLINESSTGLTKDYLLVNYANSLVYSYESKDSLMTKRLFAKIDKGIKHPEFRNYFKLSKENLKKCLASIPREALLTALIDSVGNKLTFKDLLIKSKNKIIVLDFWASWCGPCKAGMPKFNEVKKNFSNSKVDFIFISLDEKETNWRGSMEMLKIPGNHYWINDNFKSALSSYLKISGIPRYVIINQSGEVEKLNSVGPYSGENGLMTQITKLLNR